MAVRRVVRFRRRGVPRCCCAPAVRMGMRAWRALLASWGHGATAASISSDEGEIRDRLKQNLQLRISDTDKPSVGSHPGATPVSPRSRHSRGRGAAIAPVKTSTRNIRLRSPSSSPPPPAPPMNTPQSSRNRGGGRSQPPLRTGVPLVATCDGSSGRSGPLAASPLQRESLAVRAEASGSTSYARPGRSPACPGRGCTSRRGSASVRITAPVNARGAPLTPQRRQYSPVLSRRSLGGNWRPNRR